MQSQHTASVLEPRVLEFLTYLLDKYMPLGIMDHDRITDAKNVLDAIEMKLVYGETKRIIGLSSKFYRLIPHVGGINCRPIINDINILHTKREYFLRFKNALDALYRGRNPIDNLYENWLQKTLEPLHKRHFLYNRLKFCIKKTQHYDDPFKIKTIYRIRHGGNPQLSNDIGNHCFLLHSTYPNNVLSILKEGLLVTPNHISTHGSVLGKGIYFWDSSSAALDIFRSDNFDCGIILVCRVAMGETRKTDIIDDGISLNGYDSLSYRAEYYSESGKRYKCFRNARMFSGELNDVEVIKGQKYFHQYNKYLVQNSNQVRVDFIIEMTK